ncbi:MAG: hypothetical protein ACI4GO_00625 [Hominenteromicrobium sp.]
MAKRTYVKPELLYENFVLAQHIAACAWDVYNATSVEDCAFVSDETWGIPKGLFAFTENKECVDGPLESYCYTNGAAGSNLFNS